MFIGETFMYLLLFSPGLRFGKAKLY